MSEPEAISKDLVQEPPIQQRNFTGWVFLGLLFALLIGATLLENSIRKAEKSDTAQLAIAFKEAVGQRLLTDTVLPSQGKNSRKSDDGLQAILDEVAPTRAGDPSSAEVYGVIKFELRQPIRAEDIAILKHGTDRERSVYRIFTAPSISPSEAHDLTRAIPANNFFRELIRADAFSRSGNPVPRNQLLSTLRTSTSLFIGLLGLIVLCSLGSWIVFLSLKTGGGLAPLGLPNLPGSIYGADRLAAKAVLLFGAYIFLGLIVELAAAKSEILRILGGLCVIASFPRLLRMRTGGRSLTFSSLGMGRGSPWLKYVGLGAMGFTMEFPLAMFMGYVGEKVFSHQTFTHPAETELIGSHNLTTIIALLLLASVQAPLFEEMIFRGLMLPAIARAAGLIPSILITSALFACLHVQGPGAWMGLATIAIASCVLVYHTRSLAPSFVLHALHNGFTLCFVILLS